MQLADFHSPSQWAHKPSSPAQEVHARGDGFRDSARVMNHSRIFLSIWGLVFCGGLPFRGDGPFGGWVGGKVLALAVVGGSRGCLWAEA